MPKSSSIKFSISFGKNSGKRTVLKTSENFNFTKYIITRFLFCFFLKRFFLRRLATIFRAKFWNLFQNAAKYNRKHTDNHSISKSADKKFILLLFLTQYTYKSLHPRIFWIHLSEFTGNRNKGKGGTDYPQILPKFYPFWAAVCFASTTIWLYPFLSEKHDFPQTTQPMDIWVLRAALTWPVPCLLGNVINTLMHWW